MKLAKRVRARWQSYNLFTLIANTNYTRQHIRLDTFGGTADLLLVKEKTGARQRHVHTQEERRVLVTREGKWQGRWSRFDRINLAYSAAWRVLTIYSDIIKTINKMASHREHQGSISSSVPYHPLLPGSLLFLLACLRKLRSRTRLAAVAAVAWLPSKRVTRYEWMYITRTTTWTF